MRTAAGFSLLVLPRLLKPFSTSKRGGWALPLGSYFSSFLAWRQRHGMLVNGLLVICIAVSIVGVGRLKFEGDVSKLSKLSDAARADEDLITSSWGQFKPTVIDVLMLVGSFGLFFTLFLLFCRFLPMVAMAEVKAVLPKGDRPSPSSEAN